MNPNLKHREDKDNSCERVTRPLCFERKLCLTRERPVLVSSKQSEIRFIFSKFNFSRGCTAIVIGPPICCLRDTLGCCPNDQKRTPPHAPASTLADLREPTNRPQGPRGSVSPIAHQLVGGDCGSLLLCHRRSASTMLITTRERGPRSSGTSVGAASASGLPRVFRKCFGECGHHLSA